MCGHTWGDGTIYSGVSGDTLLIVVIVSPPI